MPREWTIFSSPHVMGQAAGQCPTMLGRHMLPVLQPSGLGGLGQVMLSIGQAAGQAEGQSPTIIGWHELPMSQPLAL